MTNLSSKPSRELTVNRLFFSFFFQLHRATTVRLRILCNLWLFRYLYTFFRLLARFDDRLIHFCLLSIGDVCMGYSLGPSVERCPCILPGNSDDVSLRFFFSMLFFRSFYLYRYCFIHFSFAIYFHSIHFFGLAKRTLMLHDTLWVW